MGKLAGTVRSHNHTTHVDVDADAIDGDDADVIDGDGIDAYS